MTEKEHKDVYIAAAVGGLGLVLVLLYLYGGTAQASVAQNADGTPLPSATAVAPPGISDYNYNIAPYDPNPGIQALKTGLNNLANGGSGGGCCDKCGPDNGNDYFNTNVAQFQTLIGGGA